MDLGCLHLMLKELSQQWKNIWSYTEATSERQNFQTVNTMLVDTDWKLLRNFQVNWIIYDWRVSAPRTWFVYHCWHLLSVVTRVVPVNCAGLPSMHWHVSCMTLRSRGSFCLGNNWDSCIRCNRVELATWG